MDVLPASALLFAGLTSVALSPAVVLLATVVLHHNDLILLAIGSAFVWLLAITVCASSWWATASLGDGSRLVLAVLVGAPVQEASRWLTYALYLRLLRGLHSGVGPLPPAVVSLHAMAPAAVANGVGIGLMQTLVMSGDTATRSLLPGSLYTDACTSLSLFAVNALCALGTRSRLETAPAPGATAAPDRPLGLPESLGRACSLESFRMCRVARVRTSLSWAPGMLLVNVLLSLLGWLIAYPRRSCKLGGVLVVLHLLASASTLPNSPLIYPANGCAVAPQHGRLRGLSPRLQQPVRPPTAPGAHLWALGGVPAGPERSALAAWVPRRGRCGALVPAQRRRCHRL